MNQKVKRIPIGISSIDVEETLQTLISEGAEIQIFTKVNNHWLIIYDQTHSDMERYEMPG